MLVVRLFNKMKKGYDNPISEPVSSETKIPLVFDAVGENIDVCYVGNLFVKEHYKHKHQNSLWLTVKRLGKLVLLAEIMYMNKYSTNLFKQNYVNYPHLSSLVISELYSRYVLDKDQNYHAGIMRVEDKQSQKISHEKYETTLNKQTVNNLKSIVAEIYQITECIDTVDLVKILRVDFPEYNVPEGCVNPNEEYYIPKQLIYNEFKDFSFDELKELNEHEKVKLNQMLENRK